MKPIFENQPPFNPNFKFDVQSTPTAPSSSTKATIKPEALSTDPEANNEIEQVKSQKCHTAKKISAMILVACLILGWFSYFHRTVPVTNVFRRLRLAYWSIIIWKPFKAFLTGSIITYQQNKTLKIQIKQQKMKIDQLSFYYSNELEEAMKRHSEVLERKKKAMNKLQIPLFSILAEEALDDALYQMDQDKIFD